MTVIPGRLTSADIAGFLTAQGLTAAPSRDGRLPDQPDKLIVVTMTGGPGLTVEGVFDNVSAQLRVRGDQNDPDSAEDLAWATDYLLVPPPLAPPLLPGMIGGQYVQGVTRVGGPPAFLMRDSARRTHFTGNYIFAVARA